MEPVSSFLTGQLYTRNSAKVTRSGCSSPSPSGRGPGRGKIKKRISPHPHPLSEAEGTEKRISLREQKGDFCAIAYTHIFRIPHWSRSRGGFYSLSLRWRLGVREDPLLCSPARCVFLSKNLIFPHSNPLPEGEGIVCIE